jgi:serine phosphatase RsbU (regulator of sigma subunit)
LPTSEELARQNEALNQQVKLLVKTEKRLYLAQRTIEKQLDRIHLLNRFALESNRNVDQARILGFFMDLLLEVLRVDQALVLLVDEHGSLTPAADRQLEGVSRAPGCQTSRMAADSFTLSKPIVLTAATAGAREACVVTVLDAAASHFDREVPKVEIVMPLFQEGDRLMGVVVLRTLEALHFNDQLPSDTDVPFLELACVHLASALQNVINLREATRKASLEKELEVAHTVQQALVPPPDVAKLGPVSLAGFFEPASMCGGDFWTWKQLSDERMLVVIADVTGHGVPAALITAVALGTIEALPVDATANGTLEVLNQAVRRAGKGNLLMSCFVAVMNVRTGELSFASAGHPSPYLVHRVGDNVVFGSLLARGSLLGEPQWRPLPEQSTRLAAGDIVLWYTDGITECQNTAGEIWGERRFRQAIKRAAQAAGRSGSLAAGFRAEVSAAVASYAGSAERMDDMTFVVAAYEPT